MLLLLRRGHSFLNGIANQNLRPHTHHRDIVQWQYRRLFINLAASNVDGAVGLDGGKDLPISKLEREDERLRRHQQALSEIESSLTGRTVEIKWRDFVSATASANPILRPMNAAAERTIIPALINRGEFMSAENLSSQRQDEIKQICQRTGFDIRQAMSLRKQLLVDKARNSNRNWSTIRTACNKYNSGVDIATISRQCDLPAVAIMRAVINDRIEKQYPSLHFKEKKLLTKLGIRYAVPASIDAMLSYSPTAAVAAAAATIEEAATDAIEEVLEVDDTADQQTLSRELSPAVLFKKSQDVGSALCSTKFWRSVISSSYDVQQLQLAKSLDHVSYNEEYIAEREQSAAWETALYRFFNEQGIAYLDESALQSMGSKVTPDAVLLDDCYIDGQLVRWIDCKSYYGSMQTGHFYKALHDQVKRYNQNLGGQSGAIIFRLGHSVELARKMDKLLHSDRLDSSTATAATAATIGSLETTSASRKGALILSEGPLYKFNDCS